MALKADLRRKFAVILLENEICFFGRKFKAQRLCHTALRSHNPHTADEIDKPRNFLRKREFLTLNLFFGPRVAGRQHRRDFRFFQTLLQNVRHGTFRQRLLVRDGRQQRLPRASQLLLLVGGRTLQNEHGVFVLKHHAVLAERTVRAEHMLWHAAPELEAVATAPVGVIRIIRRTDRRDLICARHVEPFGV